MEKTSLGTCFEVLDEVSTRCLSAWFVGESGDVAALDEQPSARLTQGGTSTSRLSARARPRAVLLTDSEEEHPACEKQRELRRSSLLVALFAKKRKALEDFDGVARKAQRM